MQKVLVLCYNYEASQFPKMPDEANRFYTYGFGGQFGKLIRKYGTEYSIEVWRMDSFCKGKYFEKDVDNIKYKVFRSTRVPKLGHFSIRFIRELKKEYKRSDPILFIVHTHNWQTYQIAFFLKNAMKVTTHHGEWSPFYLIHSMKGLRRVRAYMSLFAEKLVMKNISHFLIGDTRQIDYVRKAVPNLKYTMFSSGMDFTYFKPIPKAEARKMLGWDTEKEYVLYVGKLYKYKQVNELIKIWAEIKKNRPNVELALVGNEPKGSWGEEYYDMAEEYGAMIVGRVLNTELYKYYSAADVYVLFALRDDNFGGTGIAPIESLACNTPVVTNSMRNYLGNNPEEICAMPETLEGYKDAIIEILDHKDKYKNMRESVEKYYSQEAIFKRIDDVFKEVLKSHNEKK